MCFKELIKGGSGGQPIGKSYDGSDIFSSMDKDIARAHDSRASMNGGDIDDQRAARTRSLMSGPLTANTIRNDAMRSSGAKSSGITRKSLLNIFS